LSPVRSRRPPDDLSRFSLPLVPGIPLYRGSVEDDLAVVSRNRLADEITGGLSRPGKMPGPAWGLPASRCKTGAKLAGEPGTTCSSCYAMKGHYLFPAVQDRLERRYEGLFHPLWVPAMVFLIRWHAGGYFRFFDSGDLQDENHLRNICTIARHTPDIRHWLPTREYAIVQACRGEIPENLLVRVSATKVDGDPPGWWATTSTVVSSREPGPGICGAPEQGARCGECRACWDSAVVNVAYRRH
jgi:hypothetical protein